MDSNSSISNLYKVGPQYVERLAKLGIKSVNDLLFHFPHRYDDFSQVMKIGELAIGGDKVTIQGQVSSIKNIRTFRRKMTLTEAYVQDETGMIKVVWFNQPFLLRTLSEGQFVSLSGKVSLSKSGMSMSSPSYEVIRRNEWSEDFDDEKFNSTHTGRLVPVYPETAGVSSRWFRFYIKSVLYLADNVTDYMPQDIKDKYGLIDLPLAIRQIHFPADSERLAQAKKRLAFDELFLISLFMIEQKQKWARDKAYSVPFDQVLVKSFVDGLKFQLTGAQKKAAWQIFQDMGKTAPMNRLLEGDVGSGKTIVAALVALLSAKQGYQTAFMVPTEVLAKQHFESLVESFNGLDVRIGLMTNSQLLVYPKELIVKERFLREISSGEMQIVVGTHSLLQEKVNFHRLALSIVDEQHRFGVNQRAGLQKGVGSADIKAHFLSMTATPIPRTLALTLYGDLEISRLDEMPVGRRKILTKVIAPADRLKAYDFIRKEIENGRQAFVVCPLIEESDKMEAKAATEEYSKLSKEIFPKLKIGLLHGRMKSKEKDKVMSEFVLGELNILVSTSVVEVGVNVPNASVMMIEGSDRFGLAQLYQFRGRVGRSIYQSYCFLFTDSGAKTTRQRLKALVEAKNGFELAEKDLEIRGPGEFYGTRQSGMPDLAMASLTDLKLIQETKQAAEMLLVNGKIAYTSVLQIKMAKFREDIHIN